MARKPSKEKDPVSVAMILMRRQLGMSQEELAGHLDVALPTIGRWESWDPPRGIILARLAKFAEFNELPVAADFRYALEKENSSDLPIWVRAESGEEKYFRFLALLLRDPKFAKFRSKLDRFVKSVSEAPEFQMDEDPRLRQLRDEREAEGTQPKGLRAEQARRHKGSAPVG